MWTEEEIQFLRDAYAKGMWVHEIAKHIPHTETAIRQKAKREGIRHSKYYTENDLLYFEANLGRIPVETMAKKYGKDVHTMHSYIRENFGHIKENANGMCAAEVGRLLGVHRNTVLKMCKKGLRSRVVGHYRFIMEKDLFSFMEHNPNEYKALNCEQWYFNSQEWFRKKAKEEAEMKRKERWRYAG